MTYWTAAYTNVGAERKARDSIEALDRGTCLPTFAKVYYAGGRKKAFERPILNRYILVALHDRNDEAWSQVAHADGVHKVICASDENGYPVPSRVADKEVERLMWAHMTGAFNSVQHRSANGQFQKPRRRRCRPRAGKKARSLTYIKGANQDGNHAAA
jgi:transcription antitermination factor NusG